MNASTPVRFNGTLKKWNADRGFGFVVAEHGDQDVFVHMSAFPRDGQRPIVGESLSFEMALDREGRKRAVNVRRAGGVRSASVRPEDQRAGVRQRKRTHRSGKAPSSSVLGRLLIVLLLMGLGVFGVDRYRSYMAAKSIANRAPQRVMTAPAESARPQLPAEPAFRCDGRLHCSQMTSCGEAQFFLRNCPGVKMDGDGDGVPCEQQLCSGG